MDHIHSRDDFVEPHGHFGLVRSSSVLDRFASPSARGTILTVSEAPEEICVICVICGYLIFLAKVRSSAVGLAFLSP
jgi:hypothetical protein